MHHKTWCNPTIAFARNTDLSYLRGVVILLAESQKGLKKVREKRKDQKFLQKTGKNMCAGIRKIPFLSHGNPKKVEQLEKNASMRHFTIKFPLV